MQHSEYKEIGPAFKRFIALYYTLLTEFIVQFQNEKPNFFKKWK